MIDKVRRNLFGRWTCGVAVTALTLSLPAMAFAQASPPNVPYDSLRGVYSYNASIDKVSASVVKIITIGQQKSDSGEPGKTGPIGTGSGVIIDAAKGEILTNNHVVENGTSYRVELPDGRAFDAKLVGRDPLTDIALLKIVAPSLSAIAIGDSGTIKLGDVAFAIGYPFGLDQTLTMGIISGVGRSGIGDGLEDFIQTDAAVNSGNSGGALIDSRGRLIGINTAIYSKSGDNAGIAFAVPINMALAIVDQIRRNGEVKRGFIGVTVGRLTSEQAKVAGLDTERGAYVAEVTAGSPAERAGLKQGDVIVEVQGRPINSPGNLTAVIGILEPGKSLKVSYRRAGKLASTLLTVAEPPKVAVAVASGGGGASALGATYRPLQPTDGYPQQLRGVFVQSVAAGSPAERAGLQPRDVIVAIGGQQVGTVQELAAALAQAGTTPTIFVARGNSLVQLKVGN